jgi:hypothetical protein
MDESSFLFATCCLLLAAVLIPLPLRGRAVLWGVMLGSIAIVWVGIALGLFPPLL